MIDSSDESLMIEANWPVRADKLAYKLRVPPVESLEAPLAELADEVATPLGNYRLLLKGDARSVNRTLSAVATRISWFVGAMLGAIG